jgi:hypothetical protein
MANPRSAAVRSVSPASTPRPPLYVGTWLSSATSIEKQELGARLPQMGHRCRPSVRRTSIAWSSAKA